MTDTKSNETKDVGQTTVSETAQKNDENQQAGTESEQKADDLKAKIGITEDKLYYIFQLPVNTGFLKSMGWIQEVVTPWLRNQYKEKAISEMEKKGLIKPNNPPPRGFRGFNPNGWFKKR